MTDSEQQLQLKWMHGYVSRGDTTITLHYGPNGNDYSIEGPVESFLEKWDEDVLVDGRMFVLGACGIRWNMDRWTDIEIQEIHAAARALAHSMGATDDAYEWTHNA